jgi:hypothetical protein
MVLFREQGPLKFRGMVKMCSWNIQFYFQFYLLNPRGNISCQLYFTNTEIVESNI